MQNFLVLGYIPGTNIQTNLTFWLVVYAAILTWVFRWQLFAAIEWTRRNLHIAHILYALLRSELDFVRP